MTTNDGMPPPAPGLAPAPYVDIENVRAKQLVGVAYSGGGERFVIELGIVQAFIELGVIPDRITGTSAGAYAGVFHALDPRSMRYMELGATMAARALPLLRPSRRVFLFRLLPAALQALFLGVGALRLPSILPNEPLRSLLASLLPVKSFRELSVPVSVSATNLLNGAETWFGSLDAPDTPLVSTLLASSAIPAVLPPVRIGDHLYIDGGATNNLPLFHLAQQGCSVIYACNVGYAGEIEQPPVNLLGVGTQAIGIVQYANDLQQAQLLTTLYPEITVIPVRPRVELAKLPGTIQPRDVPRYIAEATQEAKRILLAAQPAGAARA